MNTYKSLVLPESPQGSRPVLLAHCVQSFLAHRKYAPADQDPVQALVTGYLCEGYGGGVLTALFMGEPSVMWTNEAVLTNWMYGWVLVHLTNGTVVDLVQANLPLKSGLAFLDAIDAAGGICATIEKGARLFPDNSNAPYLAGMLMSLGSVGFRVLHHQVRCGFQQPVDWKETEFLTKRGVLYVTLYMYLRQSRSARFCRYWLVTFHALRALLNVLANKDLLFFLN